MRYHIVRRTVQETVGGAPAWVASMTIGTWYAVGGTSLDLGLANTNIADNVDPGPSAPYKGTTGFRSILDKWNSGVFVPTLGASGSMLFYGGGHRDYYGNGVLRWDVATRTWSMLTTPSSAGPFSSGASLTNGAYVDGTPSPPHTYGHLLYHTGSGQLICLKSITNINAPDSGDSSVPRPWMLNIAQAAAGSVNWRRGPTASGIGANTSATSCYDSTRDVCWTLDQTNDDFGRFDPDGDNGDGTFGTWTTFAASGDFGTDCMMGHDPLLDWILVLDQQNGNLMRKDPANMSGARTAVSMSGTPSIVGQSGFVYCLALSRFVYHQSATGNVYGLSTSNGWTSGTWSLLTGSTNGKSFALDTQGGGIFNRSQPVTWGSSVVQICASRTSTNVLAMRLQ